MPNESNNDIIEASVRSQAASNSATRSNFVGACNSKHRKFRKIVELFLTRIKPDEDEKCDAGFRTGLPKLASK